MVDTLEYNSTREKLFIPEYGRNIQKMAEHCVTIPDREERTQMAQVVIEVMALIHNYNIENNPETLHKLWDHLFIISDFKLDVDAPFPKPEKKNLIFEPEKPAYNVDETSSFRNYGKNVKQLIQAACEIEDEDERQKMAVMLANHIKKSHLTWSRDIIPDELIIDQVRRFSHGRLVLPPDTVLMDAQDVYTLTNKTDNSAKQRQMSDNDRNALRKKRKRK